MYTFLELLECGVKGWVQHSIKYLPWLYSVLQHSFTNELTRIFSVSV